jgi:hypothetical protein
MMKLFFAKSVLIFCMLLLISACAADTSRQTDVATIEVLKTTEPDRHIQTVTIAPTNTPNPTVISSGSPDSKYIVELSFAENPIYLTISKNSSKQNTQIPISDSSFNKIEDDSFKGFRWFRDNKVLMFVLYREHPPEKGGEDFACFFAIDVEQAKLITRYCSGLPLHIWIPDNSDVVTVEHGGLNDIFDYYYPETNCYKVTLNSQCEGFNVLIEGTPLK